MKNMYKQIIITGQNGFSNGGLVGNRFSKIFNSNTHINSLLSTSKWAEHDNIPTSYITCHQYTLSYYSRRNPPAKHCITNFKDIVTDLIGIFAFRIYYFCHWLRKGYTSTNHSKDITTDSISIFVFRIYCSCRRLRKDYTSTNNSVLLLNMLLCRWKRAVYNYVMASPIRRVNQ